MGSKSDTSSNVKDLLMRQAVLANETPAPGDRTDTVGIMLRVTPDPGALVVTGDPIIRDYICAVLAGGQIDAATPDNPGQILKTLSKRRCAIIITDDVETTRTLRGLSPESYIILLTSGSEGDFVAGQDAGADDCISRKASSDAIRGRLKIARRTALVEASLRAVMHEHRKVATTDELTKVANRHFFVQHFPLEVERALRYHHPLSIALCDIDHFKRVNDQFGHAAGDEVLREFAARVQKSIRRGTDWIARTGGEEFIVVLPETDVPKAMDATEKIRLAVRSSPFKVQAQTIPVTASFGVSGLPLTTRDCNEIVERLQSLADAAMYRSKHAGRDRVTVYESTDAARAGLKR